MSMSPPHGNFTFTRPNDKDTIVTWVSLDAGASVRITVGCMLKPVDALVEPAWFHLFIL